MVVAYILVFICLICMSILLVGFKDLPIDLLLLIAKIGALSGCGAALLATLLGFF